MDEKYVTNLIESVYDEYLQAEDAANMRHRKRYDRTLSASAAGGCFRKAKYAAEGVSRDELQARPRRLMRLGTLVGEDLAKAFRLHYDQGIVLTEETVGLEEFGLVGSLDLAVIPYDPVKPIILVDFKTTASYSWTKMFGRKKNREKNKIPRYEYQICTYYIGLSRKLRGLLGDVNISRYIVYYKKDDSQLRSVLVNDSLVNQTMAYWEECHEIIKEPFDALVPGEVIGVPAESWECGYCPYLSKCPTPYKEK